MFFAKSIPTVVMFMVDASVSIQVVGHTSALAHRCRVGTGASIPLLTLKALGGWQSFSMVNRYAHLATEGTRQYARSKQRTQGGNRW
jgi:hypothetical protein